jgi:hypothetical protein
MTKLSYTEQLSKETLEQRAIFRKITFTILGIMAVLCLCALCLIILTFSGMLATILAELGVLLHQ